MRGAVHLHNVVTVERKGLGMRVTQLSEARLQEICAALSFALGCAR